MTREEWSKLGVISAAEAAARFPVPSAPEKGNVEPRRGGAERPGGSPEAMDRWLAQHGLEVKRSEAWQGGRKWVLRRCPWKPDHEDGAAFVLQFPEGRVTAGCHHHGCQGKGWRDLLALFSSAPETGDRSDRRACVPSVNVSCASDEWEEPIPLARSLPEPFPAAVLPAVLSEFVQAVAASKQTPVDLPGLLVLAVLGALGSRRFKVEVVPGYREPLNLYVAVVMDPGSRKSAIFREVTEPLAELERELQQRWAPEAALAREQRLADEGRLKSLRERAAKEAEAPQRGLLLQEAAALSESLSDPPFQPRLLVDDVTPEKLVGLLAEQGGRLALMSAEGGVFGMMAGRYGREGGPNLDVYLKGHAGDLLRVDRVGRPSETVPDPALTVGLTVQPDVLRSLAGQPGFRGRGLIARFLFALPESLVGHRLFQSAAADERSGERYGCLIRALGNWLLSSEEMSALHLSPEALMVWRAWAETVELEQREGEALAHLRDWASKLAGATVRIAGGLHLALQAEEPERSLVISGETMGAACLLGRYLRSHALAAFGMMGADPAEQLAERVLTWIRERSLSEFSLRDCYRALKTVAAEMVEALRLLETLGWLRRLPLAETGGRPSRARWAAHPTLKRG